MYDSYRKPPQSASSRFMSAWLGKAPVKEEVRSIKEENGNKNKENGEKTMSVKEETKNGVKNEGEA